MALKVLIKVTERCMTQVKGSCGFWNIGPYRILWGQWYSQQPSNHDGKLENVALVQNLQFMGVDVAKVKRLSPTLFRNSKACERNLQDFLMKKGADQHAVASIISRYPRAITFSSKELAEIWDVWGSILNTDAAVLNIVNRSPESYFRSGNIEKLVENVSFLQSLGLPPKVFSQLMSKAPRTFANSVQLNKQKVDFLKEVLARLGAEDPDECVQILIASNIFILTRSTKRLKMNIESIKTLMKLEDKELLMWLKGEKAKIVGLCNAYVESNILHIQEKFRSFSCSEADVNRYIYKSPSIILSSPKNFDSKFRLLLDCGVEAKDILAAAYVLEVSLEALRNRISILKKLDYDFKKNGLGFLHFSQSKFASKLEKLSKDANKGS